MIAHFNIEIRICELTGLSHGFDRNMLFVCVGCTYCEVASAKRYICSCVRCVDSCNNIFEPERMVIDWTIDAVHRKKIGIKIWFLRIRSATV